MIVAAAGFIVHRFRNRPDTAATNTIQNNLAPVINVSLLGTTNSNPPNPIPGTVTQPSEQRRPNMVCMNAYVGTAWKVSPGRWSAISSGRKLDLTASIIEFQNAARATGNIGAPVRAYVSFIPAHGEERGVGGCWSEEGLSYADFHVDTIHRLFVGLRLDPPTLVAVSKSNTMALGEVLLITSLLTSVVLTPVLGPPRKQTPFRSSLSALRTFPDGLSQICTFCQ
jgi:hypothetical protein